MSSPQLRFFNVGTTWTKASIGYGKYVNNSNKDIFLQRQAIGAPSESESGVRIRSGIPLFCAQDR